MIDIVTTDTPYDYKEALNIMEERVDLVVNKEANELIWLLEHEEVYTSGSREESPVCGEVKLVATGRGGKSTYHGPGQRVIYIIIDLRNGKLDLRQYLRSIESWTIRALSNLGVIATNDEKNTGVWVRNKKIASIGIRVRKWVAFHGIAININTDIKKFMAIQPCGLSPTVMTSLHELGRTDITMEALDQTLIQELPFFITSLGKKNENYLSYRGWNIGAHHSKLSTNKATQA